MAIWVTLSLKIWTSGDERLIVLTKMLQFLPFTDSYSSSLSSYPRNSPGDAVILLAREFFLGFLPPV